MADYMNLNPIVDALNFVQLPGQPGVPVGAQVGMQVVILDSNVSAFGALITSGGGANVVMGWFNGTNWLVS